MSGGGGGDTEVKNEPWSGVKKYLTDLYQQAAGLQQSTDLTPLQAQPIDQRLQNITQLWGGNPAEIAQQYGFGAGILNEAPELVRGGALDGPPIGNVPPPPPSLQPEPVDPKAAEAKAREEAWLKYQMGFDRLGRREGGGGGSRGYGGSIGFGGGGMGASGGAYGSNRNSSNFGH
jgi:hypothetical protein